MNDRDGQTGYPSDTVEWYEDQKSLAVINLRHFKERVGAIKAQIEWFDEQIARLRRDHS